MEIHVVLLKDAERIKEIDRDVVNKFNFKWLEVKVDIKVNKATKSINIGDDYVKLASPGLAFCKLCKKQPNYESRGLVALQDHVRSNEHVSILKERSSSHRLVA